MLKLSNISEYKTYKYTSILSQALHILIWGGWGVEGSTYLLLAGGCIHTGKNRCYANLTTNFALSTVYMKPDAICLIQWNPVNVTASKPLVVSTGRLH